MGVKVLLLLCVAVVSFLCALELLRFIPVRRDLNAGVNLLTSDFRALLYPRHYFTSSDHWIIN